VIPERIEALALWRESDLSMPFSRLTSLSDEELSQQRNRRLLIGLALLTILFFTAFLSVHNVMQTATSAADLMKVMLLIGLNMAVVMVIAFWITRPMQERSRRKRLVLRQAMGTFPAAED
jgi:hypothetical protein